MKSMQIKKGVRMKRTILIKILVIKILPVKKSKK